MTNTRRGGRDERAGGAGGREHLDSLASGSLGAECPEIWGQTSCSERSPAQRQNGWRQEGGGKDIGHWTHLQFVYLILNDGGRRQIIYSLHL